LLTVDLRSPFIVRHNTPHIEAWALVLADQFAPREESQTGGVSRRTVKIGSLKGGQS